MPEENKEEVKSAEPEVSAAEKKPEAKPKAEAKTEVKAEAKAESKPAEGILEKKGKKVARMTLKEVEIELKVVQEKMGGFRSHFAQDLLARKKELTAKA